jgi:HEAT repeat protein
MTPASDKFLIDIRNDNADVRYGAWSRAGEMDPEVIPALGKLLVAEPPGVRKAAGEGLKNIVHSVGKTAGGSRRAAVVRQLIALTGDGQAIWVRTVALRHLSLIGGDETVPAAAKLLRNAELQEEAAFCLERIPGSVSTAALMSALPEVGDPFKPRILAALGHRGAEEAADLCGAAVASKNMDIALAGMKATARIGKMPAVELKLPNYDSLSGWQKVEYADSVLRFADEQMRRGAAGHAVKLYGDFLKRPEEHLQCAAIIGLSKTNTPEAASLIFTKLKSDNNNVHITAMKAWAAMAPAKAV